MFNRSVAFVFKYMLLLSIFLSPVSVGAADYVVTNRNDSGAGSLRQAILDSNDTDRIVFSPDASGTISLASSLPELDSVTFVNAKGVTLSWNDAGIATALLTIGSGKTIGGTLPGALRVDGTNQPMAITARGSITFDKDMSGSIISSANRSAVGLLVKEITLNEGLSGSISATSSGVAAAGMYTQGNIEINGDMSGSIVSRGLSSASALETEQIMTLNGKLTGLMSATATGDYAVALQADNGIIINGDLSGLVSAIAGGKRARGLWSESGGVTIKGLSGSVVATAGGNEAFGLRSGNAGMTIDGLIGSVEAKAGGDTVVGIFSSEDMTINGDMSGSVTAAAGGRGATGLYADNNFVLNGDMSGLIQATGGKKAHGLWSESGGVTIKGLSGSVVATAEGNEAFGLRSGNAGMTIDGLIGSIETKAGGDTVVGIFSSEDMTINGDMSGSVTAAAGGRIATGLYADNNFVLNGDMSGLIQATGGKGNITGLEVCSALLLNGKLSGSIAATGGEDNIIGVSAYRSLVFTDDLSGSVAAIGKEDSVYGLRIADGGVSLQGLSGSITASANGNTAYGIYSYQDNISIAGDLSGAVTASAGGHTAIGLYSGVGAMNNGTGGAMNISGSVSASANGLAVAAGGDGGLNLNLTGALRAIDSSGSDEAYAVRAGYIDWRTGNWIGGAANDTVSLGNGANVTGRIELGDGINLLTMDGAGTLNGAVNNITTLIKSGEGTWDTSGGISTSALTVNEGILKVNVTQTTSPTVAATGTITNRGEVTFTLESLLGSGDSVIALSAADPLAGSGTYTSDSILMTTTKNTRSVSITKKAYTDIINSDSPGVQAMAAALDSSTGSATGDLATVLLELERAPTSKEFAECLSQLGGLAVDNMPVMSVDTARLFSTAAQTRMAELRTYQLMMADKDEPDPDDPESWPMVAANGDLAGIMHRQPDFKANGIHMRIMGRSGDMDTHSGYSGYDYNTFALSGGYDYIFRDGFLAGISGGYALTDANYKDTGSSESQAKSYTMGLYSTWFKNDWYVDATLAGAYNKYDISRQVSFLNRAATSDPTGYTVSAKTSAGQRYAFEGYGLTPTASLEYTRFNQGAYTETGAGAANLSVESVNSNFLESGLGGKIDRSWDTDFGSIIPELSAMWMHEWLTQDRSLSVNMTGMPGTVISQTTAEGANDALRIGAGVRAFHDDGLALTLRYQAEIEEHASSQSLMCEAQVVF